MKKKSKKIIMAIDIALMALAAAYILQYILFIFGLFFLLILILGGMGGLFQGWDKADPFGVLIWIFGQPSIIISAIIFFIATIHLLVMKFVFKNGSEEDRIYNYNK